ncbi:MAG: rhomboid family intramembrane serine protease [Luteolibacter sp.]
MKSTGGPFSNVARNFQQLRSSPASWAVVGVILVIHGFIESAGGTLRQPGLSYYEALGLTRDGFLAGKIWKIFTYGFLHGSWWHVTLNALFVLLIGSRIEHMAGWRVMLKALLFGIIGGGVGHLLLAAGGHRAPLLVGLSGGCIGLLLLLTTLSPQSRMMPLPISGKSLGLGILVAELMLALVNPALRVPGFSGLGKTLMDHGMGSWFDMGHACHFGGGIAGWLYGRWLLRPRITLKRLRADRKRREASES